ncbi:MAG: hydroxyethylthiazole kinase [Tissierellia bacterium]|nr:hydroxyethylthiazole kinase [Tissierellia bacterium]
MRKFKNFNSQYVEFRHHRPMMILRDDNYKTPLIQCITNFVTVNDCANIILAAGASPSMAHDIREAEDAVMGADALVCNMGAIEDVDAMILAGKKANELKKPIILDPVACGTTTLRRESIERLLKEVNFSVIRGNASEIRYIAGKNTDSCGVDVHESDKVTEENLEDYMLMAQELSKKLNSVIVITGKIDIIASSEYVALVDRGSKTMATITGSGCMLTSLIGALCGAYSDEIFLSTWIAVYMMAKAGDIAEAKRIENKTGNSTFRNDLIDAVFNMNNENLLEDFDESVYQRRD